MEYGAVDVFEGLSRHLWDLLTEGFNRLNIYEIVLILHKGGMRGADSDVITELLLNLGRLTS